MAQNQSLAGLLNQTVLHGSHYNQTVLLKEAEGGVSLLYLRNLDLQDQGGYICQGDCDSVVRTSDTWVQVYCESKTHLTVPRPRSGLRQD